MNRLLVAIVVCAGLLLASVARAYQVEIYLQPEQWYPQYSTRVYVRNNGPTGVGAINMLVTGPNSLTLNTSIYGLSLPDSSLTIDPLGDGQNFLILSNVANGISIVDPGVNWVWLADLGPQYLSSAQGSEYVLGQSTAFDTFLQPIPSVAIYLDGHEVWSYELAEPTAAALLGLGLAGFGLARRALR